MVTRVLILDTETTGLDPATDRVIEVGCILFNVPSACAVASYASLIASDRNGAESVNRIPVRALVDATPADLVWGNVAKLVDAADAFVAHRAEFDRSFVPKEIGDRKPWICSKFDLTWPREDKPGASLVQLALAHDLGVSHAHRALTDCDLLSRLLTRTAELGTDLSALLAKGLRPKATFQAVVSFDDKDKAKAASFAWEPGTKRWLRRMAKDDASALGFPVREVGP